MGDPDDKEMKKLLEKWSENIQENLKFPRLAVIAFK